MTKLRIKYLFGATGILALLGFIGLFSDDKSFLAFFAFALNLEFFFIKDDEMWDQMMMQIQVFPLFSVISFPSRS